MYTGTTVPRTYQNLPCYLYLYLSTYMYIIINKYTPKALRAAPAGAKKPARAAPEALRNLGKPKIPVFLMVGVNCM